MRDKAGPANELSIGTDATATVRGVSVLLGSTDPDRLSRFYRAVFDLDEPRAGWVRIGEVDVLFDRRTDVAARNPEPGRFVLTVDTADARAVVARLERLGVRWVSPLERRPDGLFATFEDPDGNLAQVIELDADYSARRASFHP
jgi:predicted enzyme related to lactoylglutathione lyase